MKKPLIFFSVAGNDIYEKYVKMMANSFKKFHPNLPLKIFYKEDIDKRGGIEKIKKGFTPFFVRELIKEYELVVRLDADQIILGSLDYIINQKYDVGTVYNLNRIDPTMYVPVGILCSPPHPASNTLCWLIPPYEYYNCGLVAIRSEEFVNQWWDLCNSKYINRMQYIEQDVLNYLCVFGNYKVLCFDDYNEKEKYYAWHGLKSKGEWHRAILKDKQVTLPKADDNYPDHDTVLKVIHWAGGNDIKMNYQAYFSDECIKYINYLVS